MYRRVEMQQKVKQNAHGFLDKKLFQEIQRSKFGSSDFTAHSRRYAKPQSFAYDSRNIGQFQLGIQATNLVSCNSQQDEGQDSKVELQNFYKTEQGTEVEIKHPERQLNSG